VARVSLSEAERLRVYMWLDLNCPYYGTSDSNHRELRGCRQQLPPDFTAMMKDLGERRCATCHEQAGVDEHWLYELPGSFFVRIERPERNAFLRAPLARAAGGTQRCGTAVFADTRDPDYQRVLGAFAALQRKLQETPRVDMVGSDAAAMPSGRATDDGGR
jgi:hypothetical protein